MTSTEKCDHREAQFGCDSCVRRVRAAYPEFPIIVDRDRKSKPGPLSVPWAVADKAWAAYAQRYGTNQSVERLAQRGGFYWGEMDTFFPEWREATDEWNRLTVELASERKRREDAERERDDEREAVGLVREDVDSAIHRAERAEAASAALLERLRLIYEAALSLDEAYDLADAALKIEHPGAELLEEVQVLRAVSGRITAMRIALGAKAHEKNEDAVARVLARLQALEKVREAAEPFRMACVHPEPWPPSVQCTELVLACANADALKEKAP